MTSRFSAEMCPARGLGLAGRALDGFDEPHDVPVSGGIRGMGQLPCTRRSAFGPLAARCQRHSHNHTPNHTGRVILQFALQGVLSISYFSLTAH